MHSPFNRENGTFYHFSWRKSPITAFIVPSCAYSISDGFGLPELRNLASQTARPKTNLLSYTILPTQSWMSARVQLRFLTLIQLSIYSSKFFISAGHHTRFDRRLDSLIYAPGRCSQRSSGCPQHGQIWLRRFNRDIFWCYAYSTPDLEFYKDQYTR
jgi:hypothetical protein